jgi:hypothetical protein
MTQLPPEGYRGPIPAWTMPADPKLVARVELLTATVRDLEEGLDAGDQPARWRANARRKLSQVQAKLAEAKVVRREAGKRERAIWRELWRTPQAAAWVRLGAGAAGEVAQYARLKAQAELGDLDAGKEARMHADRLGLNPAAMLRLRWEVADDELAGRRGDPPAGGGQPPAGTAGDVRARYAGLRVAGGTDAVAGS